MERIKHSIPDVDILKRRFAAVLEGSFGDFISSTHVRREAVIGSRRYALVAGVFAIAVLVLLSFIRTTHSELVWNAFAICGIFWLLIVLVSARQWFTNSTLLAKEINMALMPIVSTTLNRTVMYTFDNQHREETLQLLQESELMTIAGITVISDDKLTAFGETELTLRELLITKSQATDSGNDTSIELFKGVFVVAVLPFTHVAETYISTKNDKAGFAHQNFWSNLLGQQTVKEISLEWNDFESVLHVASSDPVAAREVLTPEFMQDLYYWWQEHKRNIRIAFKGNKFFMLLPESTIKIGRGTSSTKPQAIREYASSIILPLWRSLLLLEDVVNRRI
ncbi:MAG: DUF3137 domain-containing protein [Candidatus Moraniibacteriota bacterium]|jgi:drug/metabolite transporter superfamily protein YnfA|nr:MAG: DUF3137 domain-containing protein [Candidatus Moranbacteria bacterium]